MSGDVLRDPSLCDGDASGYGSEQVVRDPDHDLDPGPAQGTENLGVGFEKFHFLDSVVLEKPHHRRWRQRVARL